MWTQISECHRESAGALSLRVTVRFLRSALTPQISGLVPVVRRVAVQRGTGRCAPVLKGACRTRLGSDEALLPFPDLPEASNNQQETSMMTSPVGGNRPAPRHLHHRHRRRQRCRARLTTRSPTSAAGYLDGIELLTAHGVEQVGIEGSASWGAHAAIALVAAGFDAVRCPRSARRRSGERVAWTRPTPSTRSPRRGRCWPNRRSARCRRSEVYDPLVAKIEAVLEHRRMLVSVRTLVLHSRPGPVREAAGRDPRPARPRPARSRPASVVSNSIDTSIACPRSPAPTGCRGCIPLVDQDRAALRQIRQLERDTRRVCSTSTAPRCVTSPASADRRGHVGRRSR